MNDQDRQAMLAAGEARGLPRSHIMSFVDYVHGFTDALAHRDAQHAEVPYTEYAQLRDKMIAAVSKTTVIRHLPNDCPDAAEAKACILELAACQCEINKVYRQGDNDGTLDGGSAGNVPDVSPAQHAEVLREVGDTLTCVQEVVDTYQQYRDESGKGISLVDPLALARLDAAAARLREKAGKV